MTTNPFQRILGEALDMLPAPVRRLHSLREAVATVGKAEIRAARNPAARALCKIAGLPKPGHDMPVTVSFYPDGEGREFWDRHFAGRRYASTMDVAQGRHAGLLVEHFGPFDLFFRLIPNKDSLAWSLVDWRLLGVPLPGWSVPSIECTETAEGERFVFDIDVVFPVIGPVVHYRGWLASEEPAEATS